MKKRIDEIAEDIEKELLERVTESPWYAILVDEPTDVDNKALLLYIYNSTYQEDGHEDSQRTIQVNHNSSRCYWL